MLEQVVKRNAVERAKVKPAYNLLPSWVVTRKKAVRDDSWRFDFPYNPSIL